MARLASYKLDLTFPSTRLALPRTAFAAALTCAVLQVSIAYAEPKGGAINPEGIVRFESEQFERGSGSVVPRRISQAGDDLAVVRKRGYTVDELSSIHDFSLQREIELREHVRRTPPGTKLDAALGPVDVVEIQILERYVPGQVKGLIQSSFQRARNLLQAWDFPASSLGAPYGWKIFMQDSSEQRRASGFVSSERCHTAWMGPPANLFVSPDRLLSQCGSAGQRPPTEVVQAFDETMVHEIGHAVEFHLMGRGFGRRQRWHSEGFATWFEALSVNGAASGQLDRTLRYRKLLQEARQVFDAGWNPFIFNGSKSDYACSFAMIASLTDKHSSEVLFAVYRKMGDENLRFDEAVERVTGWKLETWLRETREYLKRQPLPGNPGDIFGDTPAPQALGSAGPAPMAGDSAAAPPAKRQWDDVILLPDLTSEAE